MITGTITKENNESKEFSITGTAAIQIWGDGDVKILRKVTIDAPFMPMTDNSGNEVEFGSFDAQGVIFNADITNVRQGCKFKIVGQTATQIHYIVNEDW